MTLILRLSATLVVLLGQLVSSGSASGRFKSAPNDPEADPNVVASKWTTNYDIPNGQSNGSAVYKNLYNALYNHGYHDNPAGTHSAALVRYLSNVSTVSSVIDIGCSHGAGVSLLWGSGKVAAGVDIAVVGIQHAKQWRCKQPPGSEGIESLLKAVAPGPNAENIRANIAAANAAAVECSPEQCGPAPSCFQVGSALAIPAPDKSYDALMSTDVLEHIFMADVPKVLAEFARVARKMIVVKVASMAELKNFETRGVKKAEFSVDNLHVTSQKLEWWEGEFGKVGWRLEKVIHKLIYRGYYGGFQASFVPL